LARVYEKIPVTISKSALQIQTINKNNKTEERAFYPAKIFFLFLFKLFLCWAGPRPHIPFPPDLIFYVNLVAMGPVHLSPVTWPQALRYWYSLTPLMHIVAQLRPYTTF
jgi:hypothetical protein